MSIQLEQKKPVFILIYILIFSTVFYFFVDNFQSEVKPVEQMNIDIFSKTLPVEIGKNITLQVLVNDSDGLPVDNAKLTITLEDSKGIYDPIHKNLTLLENGLYEGDVTFRSGGRWSVKAKAFIKGNTLKNETVFFVEAPIFENL